MWVITDWHALTLWDGVILYCTTDTPTHLYAIWTLTEPSRVPRYKLNRGVWMFCGWEYVLHNSTATQQSQPGNSTLHSFYLHPIPCSTTVWFILTEQPVSAPKIPTAGLFHYTTDPCDMPTPCARISRSLGLQCPIGIDTFVPMNVLEFDNTGMVDLIAFPTRITVSIPGFYQVTATSGFGAQPSFHYDCSIFLNGITQIAENTVGNIGAAPFSRQQATRLIHLAAGDFVELVVNNSNPAWAWLEINPPHTPALSVFRIPGTS